MLRAGERYMVPYMAIMNGHSFYGVLVTVYILRGKGKTTLFSIRCIFYVVKNTLYILPGPDRVNHVYFTTYILDQIGSYTT